MTKYPTTRALPSDAYMVPMLPFPEEDIEMRRKFQAFYERMAAAGYPEMLEDFGEKSKEII